MHGEECTSENSNSKRRKHQGEFQEEPIKCVLC